MNYVKTYIWEKQKSGINIIDLVKEFTTEFQKNDDFFTLHNFNNDSVSQQLYSAVKYKNVSAVFTLFYIRREQNNDSSIV